MSPAQPSHYQLIILAGGRGERMGGADKGLLQIQGQPLIGHLLAGLQPAPSRVIISANRHHQDYQPWADQVISDQGQGFQGPLAGLQAALGQAQGTCVCLPCDLWQPPATMIGDLLSALQRAPLAVIRDPRQRQHLCLAMQADYARSTLRDYLGSGQRSAHGWLDSLQPAPEEVPVAQPLHNLNHPEDLDNLP